MTLSEILHSNPSYQTDIPFLVQLALDFHVRSIPLAIFILILILLFVLLIIIAMLVLLRLGLRHAWMRPRMRRSLKSVYLDELNLSQPKDTDSDLGTLEYSIEYNIDRKSLNIGIVRAVNLKPRPGLLLCDAYVKISVYLQLGIRRVLIEPRHTTSVRKNTRDPIWRELFQTTMTQTQLKNTHILFRVYDKDNIGQDGCLGRLEMSLAATEAVKYCGHIWETFDVLRPAKMYVDGIGELCIGLCLCPYMERLDVIVYEVKHLRNSVDSPVKKGQVKELSIAVEIRRDGRAIGRRQTQRRTEVFNPYFNERVFFSVKKEQLANCELRFILQRHLFCRKQVMGRVVIGKHAKITTGIKHLEIVLNSPLKTHVMWHPLME